MIMYESKQRHVKSWIFYSGIMYDFDKIFSEFGFRFEPIVFVLR